MDKNRRHTKSHDAAPAADAADTAAEESESLLTEADLELLLRLDPTEAGDTHTRRDLVALLADPETAAALQKYESYFKTGGVMVGPALEAAPRVAQLVRLRDRLERSVGVVNKHLATTGGATVGTIQRLHKALSATVENSPVRLAFRNFEAAWDTLYAPKSAKKAAPTEAAKKRAKDSDDEPAAPEK